MLVKWLTDAKHFRLLVDTLKDILVDITLRFDKNGVRIQSVSPEKMCILNVHIDTASDHLYDCPVDTTFSLHLPLLHKIVRGTADSDTLQLLVLDFPKRLELSIYPTDAPLSRKVTLTGLEMDENLVPLDPKAQSNVGLVNTLELRKAVRAALYLNKKIALVIDTDVFGIDVAADAVFASTRVNVPTEWVTKKDTAVRKEFYGRNLEKILKIGKYYPDTHLHFDSSDDPIKVQLLHPRGSIELYIAPVF